MQKNRSLSLTAFSCACLATGLMLAATPCTDAKKKHDSAKDVSFKREETIVLNLTKAPKSARFFILQSLRTTREAEKNLDHAMRQVQQADATFAKSRNHRDDRTMTASVARLKAALDSAKQLEDNLTEADQELKSDVQQTLVSPR